MVYNNAVYRPGSLSERLQAKFGERAASATFRMSSDNRVSEKGQSAEVLSFFGRTDDSVAGDRAIPVRKTAPVKTAVRTDVSKKGAPRANARPAAKTARSAAKSAPAKTRKAGTAVRKAPQPSLEITGTFARAYAVGEQVRLASEKYAGAPKRRYAEGAVPSGALRRGRSNIPGARHAVLVTADGTKDRRSVGEVLKSAFTDRHVAEHRVQRSPFPLGFVTLIGICAIMVMVLLYSFSQIHEYNSSINSLRSTQQELGERAAKLEVQLEERDDIRDIERIAIEQIGMVSSDMVQSKFVSVSASDRVEVLRSDEAEEEKGFSALLSVIGDRFERLGEYFN